MRFIIDGSEWNFPHMESLSREEQLDSIREHVAAEGRVIVDMLSDGESIDDDDFMNVPDSIDLDIVTSTPFGLGLEILGEVKNSLLAVFKGLQTALDGSNMFDSTTLSDVREQLTWVGEALASFSDAFPEYLGSLPDTDSLSRAVDHFAELLNEGHYAEANEWHEHEWKRYVLPPFLNDIKFLKDWLEAEDKKDESPIQEDVE